MSSRPFLTERVAAVLPSCSCTPNTSSLERRLFGQIALSSRGFFGGLRFLHRFAKLGVVVERTAEEKHDCRRAHEHGR